MVTGLQEFDALVLDHIHETMLLGEAARPDIGAKIFEGFGFADPVEGVAQYRLDQIEKAQGQAAIGFHPVAPIFQKLGMEGR